MIRIASLQGRQGYKGAGVPAPFVFSTPGRMQGAFAERLYWANFTKGSIEGVDRDGGKRKGQLWKQPTVNDCLPYEKEVVVFFGFSAIGLGGPSSVDDTNVTRRFPSDDTSLSPGFDLKGCVEDLKRLPEAASIQKRH